MTLREPRWYHGYTCCAGYGDGLRAPQPQSTNSDSSIVIDLYEASEHNGPVLHYYVVVVNNVIAEHTDPNDFDMEQVIIPTPPVGEAGI